MNSLFNFQLNRVLKWDYEFKIVFNGGIKLDKLLFIGSILSHYSNQYVMFFYHNFVCLNFCIVTIVLFISSYYDLSFFLIVYGIIYNMGLASILKDIFILPFSIILFSIIAILAFFLWYAGFWGGGDFKVFIALTLSVSFIDYFEFNVFNLNSFNFNSNYGPFLLNNLNLPICNQLVFYPKVLSILFNSILLAFAFVFLMILYHILKNGQTKHSFLSIMNHNIEKVFNQFNRKTIDIKDLKEGMILDKYYFKESKVFEIINSKKNSTEDLQFNLNAYIEDELYYFNSLNRIGLTINDIELINQFYEKGLIKNPDFRIKVSIPFMPFLTLGYIIFLTFGDLIYLISSFFKVLI